MKLTFQEMEKFVDLADTLNFRASAERCSISQPAFSRAIASIENKLGVRLFDRSTHEVTLTPTGLQLLPIAQRMVLELNNSLNEISEFVAGHRGKILLASVPSAAAVVLPGLMQAFLEEFPNVSIGLEAVSANDVSSLVAEGTVDIGVCTLEPSSQRLSDNCSFMPVADDELLLMCAQCDPLAHQKVTSWGVFTSRPYISNGPASSLRPLVEQAFRHSGLVIQPRYESMNLPVTARMVASGLGIAVMSSLSRSVINTDGIAFLRLNNPFISRKIGVLTRKDKTLPPPAQEFYSRLINYSAWKNHLPPIDSDVETVLR